VISPARLAAARVLRDVESGRADLPSAIAHARVQLSDDRDRSLLVELATGTLRWLAAVDHVIAHGSGRPAGRLDTEVRAILRLGVYQLLHLDRIPAAAIVNDAVEMTRRAGKSSASGLVNAVLRHVSRTRHNLPLPPRPALISDGAPRDPAEALEYLATTLSHPRWLVERWLSAHGFEATERWALFDNAPAPLTVRANTLRTTPAALADALRRHGVESRPTEFAPEGLVITRGNPLHTPLASTGLFMVQDEASQAAACLGLAAPGERVLDACASPGGKSLTLAAGVGPDGTVVAGDVRRRRIELLRRTLATAGANRTIVVQIDLTAPLPFRPLFDCVFVDAPCSGLGTIRRDPEIRWRRAEEDLAGLARAQSRMLHHAAAAVRPGGRLVYATCSSEPDENEQIVARFLDTAKEFFPLDRATLVESLPPGPASLIDSDGHLRSWPWRHALEAFFGAVLIRRG
jgi:16S rRNA (cytosine967-C5)-methyltransferase